MRMRFEIATAVTALFVCAVMATSSVSAQDTGTVVSGVFEEPRNLMACQVAYGEVPVVRLSWDNPELYERMVIEVGGVPAEARVDGAFGVAEVEAPLGVQTFDVRGVVGAFSSRAATVSFEVLETSPVGNPVEDLTCELVVGGGGGIIVRWSPGGDAWVSGEVRIPGRHHVGFGADVSEVDVSLAGDAPDGAVIAFKNEDNYFSEPIELVCVRMRPTFRRGDCDTNGFVNISDAIFEVNHLFLGRTRWLCDDSCDANDDGEIDLGDALTILGYLFHGEGPTPDPGPINCGIDPTEDPLGGICTNACI